MTPAEFERAIRAAKYPPLLLLHGEEPFFLERHLRELRDRLVPEGARDFNLTVFHGKDARAQEILDCARTYPVFHSHRLVVLRDLQALPAAELETLLPYLADPCPETVLVAIADKIDGRKKFFQEFKKKGGVVEYRRLYDNQVPGFVRDQAQAKGFAFSEDGMALFCRRVGSSLAEIDGELVKLSHYLGTNRIADVREVAAVVSDTRVDSIFDLTNALGRRDAPQALRALSRLLEEGTAPLLVLTMMVRHFRQLWRTRELLDLGIATREIPRRIGLNPYFLDGIVQQARQFGADRYREIFELFLGIDLALKSSGAHPGVVLERLILEIAAEE